MSNIYFCSFASSDIIDSLNRIGIEVLNFKIFKDIFLYTELNIDYNLKKECEAIINITGN